MEGEVGQVQLCLRSPPSFGKPVPASDALSRPREVGRPVQERGAKNSEATSFSPHIHQLPQRLHPELQPHLGPPGIASAEEEDLPGGLGRSESR